MLNVCLYFLKHYKNFTILYAFPTADQVRRFSNARFNDALTASVNNCLNDLLLPGGKQNVHHKQFKGSSQIFLYSAWGQADQLRGIACDMLVKDEVQDWSQGGINNTKESMTQSRYSVDLSIGTPKGEGSYYHEIWTNSDQRYFHLRCIHCGKLFKITLNVCKQGTLVECPHCKKCQEKREAIPNGVWIPSVNNPQKTQYVGFHLSQLVHPDISIEKVWRSKTDYGEKKWRNEVLGEFTGSMDKPLEPKDIIDIIHTNEWHHLDFENTVAYPEETVMGIDWGSNSYSRPSGAYTVVVIVKPIITEKGFRKFRISYAAILKFDKYEQQVEEIKKLIYRYNCRQVVADQGFGHVQIQQLQAEFGPRIAGCHYQTNMKAEYKFDSERQLVSADKDYALEELFTEIQDSKWIIPYKDGGFIDMTAKDSELAESKIEWLIKHICNIEIVEVFRGGNTRRTFQKTNYPCDGLHALNYARLALIAKGHILRKSTEMNSSGFAKPLLAAFSGRRF
jgi:hypothetical protein